MKTINEIKSIEITLEEDNVFKTDFNGYKEQEGYNLIIPKDNALRVARTLTRMANMIWEKYDIIANEKMEKEEQLCQQEGKMLSCPRLHLGENQNGIPKQNKS